MNIRTLIPLIFAAAVLVASVVLYAGGYYLLNSLMQKSGELATEVAAKNQELENATRAHAALATVASQEGSLDQYLVSKQDIVPFLESLQSVGRPLGSSVNVLSVTDAKDKTRARIQLQLAVTGSFDSVMRTLGAIEYGPYDGVITNLSISTAVGDAVRIASGTAWTALATYSVGVRATSTTP